MAGFTLLCEELFKENIKKSHFYFLSFHNAEMKQCMIANIGDVFVMVPMEVIIETT